jgi:hypothetical protein
LKLFWDNDNPSVGGFTFEFEFNPYNLYSYHLLTTETITEDNSDELDDKVNIQRTFDTSKAIITYLASNDDDCGLACGTQDAFFRTSGGEHATARYSNDNIVNVTMVVDAKNRYL